MHRTFCMQTHFPIGKSGLDRTPLKLNTIEMPRTPTLSAFQDRQRALTDDGSTIESGI